MSIRRFVISWPFLGFVPAIALSFVGCSVHPRSQGPCQRAWQRSLVRVPPLETQTVIRRCS